MKNRLQKARVTRRMMRAGEINITKLKGGIKVARKSKKQIFAYIGFLKGNFLCEQMAFSN